jgi:hypothetical protein
VYNSGKLEFSMWRKAKFVVNRLIQLRYQKTCISLERKPSVLEAAASKTLFPCEN